MLMEPRRANFNSPMYGSVQAAREVVSSCFRSRRLGEETHREKRRWVYSSQLLQLIGQGEQHDTARSGVAVCLARSALTP